jgi:hypothetical protein
LALALTEYHKTWQSIHHLRTRSFGIGWDKTKPGFAGTGVYFISGGFYAKICFLAGTHSIAAVFDFLVDDGVWG